jgi:hypothetical protein
MLDHGDPGGVQLACRCGGAPPGDAVGLLDERDAHFFRQRGSGRRHEIRRRHPAAGSVPEHERGPRLDGRVQVHLRLAVRRVDLDGRHARLVGRIHHEMGEKRATLAGINIFSTP